MTWRAFLKGHSDDLELLVDQFDRGRARVVCDGEEFWLESRSFDGLLDASAVQAAARRLLGEVNGAAKLIDASFRAVELQGRFSDGTGVHVVLAEAIMVRDRAIIATAVARDMRGNVLSPPPPVQTKAPAYLDLAGENSAVREVLQLLSDDHQDWFTLYKVMEIVQTDAGGLGAFATKSESTAFRVSANDPVVSGEAARHARLRGGAPRHSMTIDEGWALIQRVVRVWLASK